MLYLSPCFVNIYVLRSCIQPRRFNRGNAWMRLGVAPFFFIYSGLIGKFVFDILRIPGGGGNICRRCCLPICTSLAACLTDAAIGQVLT